MKCRWQDNKVCQHSKKYYIKDEVDRIQPNPIGTPEIELHHGGNYNIKIVRQSTHAATKTKLIENREQVRRSNFN